MVPGGGSRRESIDAPEPLYAVSASLADVDILVGVDGEVPVRGELSGVSATSAEPVRRLQSLAVHDPDHIVLPVEDEVAAVIRIPRKDYVVDKSGAARLGRDEEFSQELTGLPATAPVSVLHAASAARTVTGRPALSRCAEGRRDIRWSTAT